MSEEYYEDLLEQVAINKYLNMIANDYNGELAKIFEEKYIRKDKEIERLKERLDIAQTAYLSVNGKNYKAIEYIKSNCIFSDTWKEIEPNEFVPIGNITYKPLSSKKVKELIEILKDDKK